MKILHVNLSDKLGGASIAMHRIHEGLRSLGVDSNLLVHRLSDDKLVEQPEINVIYTGWQRKMSAIRHQLSCRIGRLQKDPNSFFCSLNLFRNQLLKRIDSLKPDLVNLHWVGAEILRIEDLPKIKVPIVWTLMDMWPFCGAEHYDFGDRFKQAYSPESRHELATGVDLNRRVWNRKFRSWANTPVTTVCPSSWILDCVNESSLWKDRSDCRHELIPFGYNTDDFQPRDVPQSRQTHQLEGDKPLLLFGADNINSPMKGMPWLIEALELLHQSGLAFRIASFGRGDITELINPDIESVSLGSIHDPKTLSEIYSAADLMLVPSRLESFGQTASEASACATPVVCFDISGVTDIVAHQETGFRAKPYSPEDFANGIRWCLEDKTRLNSLSTAAAKRSKQLFDINVVSQKYKDLYDSILSEDDAK